MSKKSIKYVNYKNYQKLKDGLFCLNKSKFRTSAETVELVKNNICLDAKKNETAHKLKVGHGGTLDSSATGVLVIGTGLGCKLLTSFLHCDKVYVVDGKLGVSTDTYNAEGRILNKKNYCHIDNDKFIASLKSFEGEIMQFPPPYCALKRRGQRISDLIQSGVEVVMTPRLVKCISIECIKLNIPYFTLRVTCGGGFYVRSLVHDLGLTLECFAHVTDLRREKQGPFTLEDCLSPHELNPQNISLAIQKTLKKYSQCYGSKTPV